MPIYFWRRLYEDWRRHPYPNKTYLSFFLTSLYIDILKPVLKAWSLCRFSNFCLRFTCAPNKLCKAKLYNSSSLKYFALECVGLPTAAQDARCGKNWVLINMVLLYHPFTNLYLWHRLSRFFEKNLKKKRKNRRKKHKNFEPLRGRTFKNNEHTDMN